MCMFLAWCPFRRYFRVRKARGLPSLRANRGNPLALRAPPDPAPDIRSRRGCIASGESMSPATRALYILRTLALSSSALAMELSLLILPPRCPDLLRTPRLLPMQCRLRAANQRHSTSRPLCHGDDGRDKPGHEGSLALLLHAPDLLVFVAVAVAGIELVLGAAVLVDVLGGEQMHVRHEARSASRRRRRG